MQVTRGWQTIRLLAVVLLAAALTVGPVLAAPLVDDEDPPDETPNTFCVTEGAVHPVGNRLTGFFEADYDTIMDWFCNKGVGFGQIMLALTTARVSEEMEPEELLEKRIDEGMGWGEIWQEMGLIGRNRIRNGEEGEEGESGPPAGIGRPFDKGLPPGLDRGEGNGPPGLQNRPQNPGNSRGRGRP